MLPTRFVGPSGQRGVRFVSADGGATFALEQVSTTDPHTAHWFPHLERPLGIVPPPASPGIPHRHPVEP